MDGKVFISHQIQHLTLVNINIKVLFPICNLTWRVKNYVFCQGKGIKSRNESTILLSMIIFVTPGNTLFVR